MKLRAKKFKRIPRRFSFVWLAEQPNFTLIYAAVETSHRHFRSLAHHAKNGPQAPSRIAAGKLYLRYAKIMSHLTKLLKA